LNAHPDPDRARGDRRSHETPRALGGASILATVDKDPLAVRDFQGIAIIKPGEFWRKTTG
jgi:hypothetical protein